MKNTIIRYQRLYYLLTLLIFEMGITISSIFRLQSCNCVLPFPINNSPFWYIYDNFLLNNIFAYLSIALGILLLFLSSRKIKHSLFIIEIILFVQMFVFFYSKQYNLNTITLVPYFYDFIAFIIEGLLIAGIYLSSKKKEENNDKPNLYWHIFFIIIIVIIQGLIFYLCNL